MKRSLDPKGPPTHWVSQAQVRKQLNCELPPDSQVEFDPFLPVFELRSKSPRSLLGTRLRVSSYIQGPEWGVQKESQF